MAFRGGANCYLLIWFIISNHQRAWASKAGGGGDASPAVEKSARDVPPRNDDILASFFLDSDENFAFSTIFKMKWPKSEEKLNFGGRWVWVPMNPSPQTNFRGNAPANGSTSITPCGR